MPKETEQVFVYTCKEYIVHRITGEKRICGKIIRSISRGQFDYWVQEHKAKHAANKKGIRKAFELPPTVKAK